MVSKRFGRTVKNARKSLGMSQRELAKKIGIDYGYLSKIESGKFKPPSEKVILKISTELELDKDELLVLADKAPSDLDSVITEASYIPAILRRAKGLSREDWEEIEELIESKQRHKNDSTAN